MPEVGRFTPEAKSQAHSRKLKPKINERGLEPHNELWRVIAKMFGKLRMSLSAGLVAASLCAGANVQALTLDCQNKAYEPIAVAVSYLGDDGSTWYVEGWYNLKAQEHALIELPSSNNVFYIFGEFKSGIKVEGGYGSIQIPVLWDNFQYTQADALIPQKADAVEQFVRGLATNGYAQISFGPVSAPSQPNGK